MIARAFRVLLPLLLLWLPVTAAVASASPQTVTIASGQGTLLALDEAVATVFVADPQIADVQVPDAHNILLLGKRTGRTTVYALSASGRSILRRTVSVVHDIQGLSALLEQRFPDAQLSLESAPGSLMVSGQVDSPDTADSVLQTLRGTLSEQEKLVSNLSVRAPTQVYLRVRIAEVSQEVSRQLGINWQAVVNGPGNFITGLANGRDFIGDNGDYTLPSQGWSFLGGFQSGDVNLQAFIDVLDRQGLVSVLAQPNLTAISGETASFLAGGEFPIPISDGNDSISVEFKSFGVALDFTPTVLDRDRISLKVSPEVSELSVTNSVTLDGFNIPGLTVRRANTTVEMSSGQSLAIGGLLQNNLRDVVNSVPGIGDIPILGTLFRSRDWQENRSELVIIVTPYIVKPADPKVLTDPLQTLRPASDVEYIVQQRLGLDPLDSDLPRLSGAAGFIY